MITLIYILIGFALLILLFAILIRKYGPRTGRKLEVGIEYQVKGRTKQIGEFDIQNKIYLMRQEVIDDLYDLIKYGDQLLNKHKIPYTLSSGTLLGAVRHGGLMPWDDDADFFVYLPYEEYEKVIPKLREEIENDGYVLRRSYDTTFYHIVKKGAKQNFPYLDLYFHVGQYGDDSNIFPVQRIPFEDYEVNAPHKLMECLIPKYDLNGKSDPLKEIVCDYPFSRYYSLWIAQILKKYPLIHAPMEWIARKFVKLF